LELHFRLIFFRRPFIAHAGKDFAMNKHTKDIEKDRALHSETRVVSFDVFDTFLLRACTTSEGVFERAFQFSPIAKVMPEARTAYVQHRRQAEGRARRTSQHRARSSEVRIADIYRYFPFRLFGLDSDALPRLVEAEFEAEIDLCRTNVAMAQQYAETRKAGIRTGFISDTYWSREQLSHLLRACHQGLEWDFLYASCEFGTGKSDGLFEVFLTEQSVDPAHVIHIGDNEHADIKGAHRHRIGTKHVPQATAALVSIFQREAITSDMLLAAGATKLDLGMQTLRRVVASRILETTPQFSLGLNVIGPVICAFDAFIADRVARLERAGGNVAIAFLGRDGFLSYRVWQQEHDRPASYLAINRRVSMIASAKTLDPLIELLGKVPQIDAKTFVEMVKIRPSQVMQFFAACRDGVTTGEKLIEALPHLMEQEEVAALAADMRSGLLRYMRDQISVFDDCTDLVVVDLGYAGSIQKALRRVFDIEDMDIRLHGLYLMSMDDAFDDIAEGDTAEGFISDLVVNPHANRVLMRNGAPLEQMCCAPTGSVREYKDGEVIYEPNPRSPEQLSFGREVQAGVLEFAGIVRQERVRYRLDPFANLNGAARSAASIVGRLLLLPTNDEVQLLGRLRHDVNLGTHAMVSVVDDGLIERLQVVQSFPVVCTAPAPPMWLAGSFATLSPLHGFLYLLFGADRLPPDIFGDAKCSEIEIGLLDAHGGSSVAYASCYRTGFGELRMRFPMTRAMAISTIVVPIGKLAQEGIILGPFMQNGADLKEAMHSVEIAKISDSQLAEVGLARNGRHFQVSGEDGALIIHIPPLTSKVGVVSVGVMSLSGDRIMAR
jgi:FMN phosphatase YigB (HAD superfamily)